MYDLLKQMQEILVKLEAIDQKLSDLENTQHFDGWIPRKTLMEFLNYGDTQIAALLKDSHLIVAEIGARKFIQKKSFLDLLEKNIRKSGL